MNYRCLNIVAIAAVLAFCSDANAIQGCGCFGGSGHGQYSGGNSHAMTTYGQAASLWANYCYEGGDCGVSATSGCGGCFSGHHGRRGRGHFRGRHGGCFSGCFGGHNDCGFDSGIAYTSAPVAVAHEEGAAVSVAENTDEAVAAPAVAVAAEDCGCGGFATCGHGCRFFGGGHRHHRCCFKSKFAGLFSRLKARRAGRGGCGGGFGGSCFGWPGNNDCGCGGGFASGHHHGAACGCGGGCHSGCGAAGDVSWFNHGHSGHGGLLSRFRGRLGGLQKFAFAYNSTSVAACGANCGYFGNATAGFANTSVQGQLTGCCTGSTLFPSSATTSASPTPLKAQPTGFGGKSNDFQVPTSKASTGIYGKVISGTN